MNDLNYLKLLSKQFPTVDAVSSEIVSLSAIINLPKGSEHFLADIHGEHEAFDHVMRNASAEKIFEIERSRVDSTLDRMIEEKVIILDSEEAIFLLPFYHSELGIANRMKAILDVETLYPKTNVEGIY